MSLDKKWRQVGAGLILATLALAPGWALAGKVSDYAGDMVSLDSAGKVESSHRIHVSGQKMRVEVPPQEGMDGMIMIIRPDRKLQWMLDPKNRTATEYTLNEAELRKMAPALAATPDPAVKEENLGTDTVQGYRTSKKRITTTMKVMGQSMRNVSTIWQAEEFDIPLREQDQSGQTEEFRNIKAESQPADLFEVPKGYKITKGTFGTPPGMEGMQMPEGMQLPEGMQMPQGMPTAKKK